MTYFDPFRRRKPSPKRKDPRRVRDREILHGEAKTERRREIFERSGGRCEACCVCGKPEDAQEHKFWEPPGGHQFQRCTNPISPVTMQWAHKRHAARKHDGLASGIAACLRCHAISHNAGGKPVNRRPGRPMSRKEAMAYLAGQKCFCEGPKKPKTALCETCRAKLSPQASLDLDTCEGRDWLAAMGRAEDELLAWTVKSMRIAE